MKITRNIVKNIKQACRKACGGIRRVEAGARSWPDMPPGSDGFNFLLWGEGHDLDTPEAVESLINQNIQDDQGWVALDCYCYNLPLFGREPDDALDCNVYVLIDSSGTVRYASQDDRGHAAAIDGILKAAGHPGYTPED